MIGFNALGRMGRLGNQMFQYACGSALADQYNVSHYLDLSAFSGYSSDYSYRLFSGMALHQGFQLGEIFHCDILKASDEAIKDTIGWDGEFNFDTTKPEGVLEKKVDGSIGMKIINWEPNYSLKEGVKKTIDWYIENYE